MTGNSVCAADLDRDGRTDLLLSPTPERLPRRRLPRRGHRADLSLISDFGCSQLWWNNGDGTFTEGRDAAGVATDENGMGIAIGDIDRDGRLDILVSSFDIPSGGVLVPANRLYLNRGDSRFADVAPAYEAHLHS